MALGEVWSKHTRSYGQLRINYSPFSLSNQISFFFLWVLGRHVCSLFWRLFLARFVTDICIPLKSFMTVPSQRRFRTRETKNHKQQNQNSVQVCWYAATKSKAPPSLSTLRREYNLGRVSITPIWTSTKVAEKRGGFRSSKRGSSQSQP